MLWPITKLEIVDLIRVRLLFILGTQDGFTRSLSRLDTGFYLIVTHLAVPTITN